MGRENFFNVWEGTSLGGSNCEQATKALRDLVGKQGLMPGEYALHSGRIEGVTRLVASSLQAGVGYSTRRKME